nr:lysozyme inhibitor LprI family protein [Rhizobium sp. SSA_523]
MDAPTVAEDKPSVPCDQAVSQLDINICADQDYRSADDDLNSQWAKTKTVLAGWDAELDAHNKGAVDALTKAQRAWISYRDAHCDAVGYSVFGGSLYQAVILGCMAEVTRQRTEELKKLADGAP